MIVWHCVCSRTRARLCVSVHVHVRAVRECACVWCVHVCVSWPERVWWLCVCVYVCGSVFFSVCCVYVCGSVCFSVCCVYVCGSVFFSVCSPLFALWISIFCRYCRSALVIRKTCVDSISPCFFRFLSGVLPTYEMSWVAVDRSHPLLIFDTRTCSKFLTKSQDKAVPLTVAS